MRHEREMVCAIVKGKSYRPGLTFDDAELAAIRQPTLHVHGTADETVGSADSLAARRGRAAQRRAASRRRRRPHALVR